MSGIIAGPFARLVEKLPSGDAPKGSLTGAIIVGTIVAASGMIAVGVIPVPPIHTHVSSAISSVASIFVGEAQAVSYDAQPVLDADHLGLTITNPHP